MNRASSVENHYDDSKPLEVAEQLESIAEGASGAIANKAEVEARSFLIEQI
jgi:hypothetical protein